MTDREIIEGLCSNDRFVVQHFFFVRCRPALVYIGQYFCPDRQSPEELIGEFYEFLAADDWHKLRIFKYTCSLNSYVSIIASRYFQHQRDRKRLPLDDNFAVWNSLRVEESTASTFFLQDLDRIVNRMAPFDRFLVQRILIEGHKPGEILEDARKMIDNDESLGTDARTPEQLAGYIYTRYCRIRRNLQKQMAAIGYGK